MKKNIAIACLILIIIATTSFATFTFNKVEVGIGDIGKDGSARINEKIRFTITGDEDRQSYESGINRNELSFWFNVTGVKEIQYNIDTSRIAMEELSIVPQPINDNRCNVYQKACIAEIWIQYIAKPKRDSDGIPVSETGIFTLEKYKPRTTRYTLNDKILLFTTTDKNQTIIDKNHIVIIELPKGAIIKTPSDLKPMGTGLENEKFPMSLEQVVWTNTPPANPVLVFETEETIYSEVSGFFRDSFQKVQNTVYSNEGMAIILILIILFFSYFYLNSVKPKK
ncbi:MAG: hypothetical protein ABII22_01345 [Candidatus Micrarchaeota archaeon]